ncbi:MAG: FtsX-like permease family protein [Cellulosilyticaceae bacterium]
MNKIILKETGRVIHKSFGRFFSILAIVALGVAFLAGISLTSPMMKATMDNYMDEYNLMDLRLLSTIGFDYENVENIRNVDGVLGVYPGITKDVIGYTENADGVMKLTGMPFLTKDMDDENYINQLEVISGRLPEAPNEVVIDNTNDAGDGVQIGTTIKLKSGTEEDLSDVIHNTEYTVVGIVRSPYYAHYERGSSSIGNGKVQNILYVSDKEFKEPVYTEIFLTLEGAKELDGFEEEYNDLVKIMKERIEPVLSEQSIIRFDTIKQDTQKQLEIGQEKLNIEKQKVEEELENSKNILEEARIAIKNGEDTLKKQREDALKGFEKGEQALIKAEKDIAESRNKYTEQHKSFMATKPIIEAEIINSEKMLNEDIQKMESIEVQIQQMIDESESLEDIEEKDKLKLEIDLLQKQYDEGIQKNIITQKEIEVKRNALVENESVLQNVKKTIEASAQKVSNEKEALLLKKEETVGALLDAEMMLDEKKAEFLEGEEAYKEGKKQAEEAFIDAEKSINETAEMMDTIKSPSIYMLGRETNYGIVNYGQATETMESISKIFPLFFFLVAALVCLTTMTRMVDEGRLGIGTYKALGYSTFEVMQKYILYAGIASLVGSIFGVLIGITVFPNIIYDAYRITFDTPDLILKFEPTYVIVSVVMMVALTVSAAVVACLKELKDQPSALMRPKAPQVGKKIMLERIPFIWSRFNFLQKIVARNIFRYKKKFLMTTIGIAGCTALLVAGLGLKNSIFKLVPKQYGEIFRQELEVTIKEGYDDVLIGDETIKERLGLSKYNMKVSNDDVEEESALIIPSTTEQLDEFLSLQDRKSGEQIPLEDDGVILTEKLAKTLGVKVGDIVKIQDKDFRIVEAKVTGIAENYIGHYMYMNLAYYESLYSEAPVINQYYMILNEITEEQKEQLTQKLIKDENIITYAYTLDNANVYYEVLGSLDTIIWVMVISAGLLAFIVLYNLTTINVSERIRELATIKVLGFYDLEVSKYIYRENIILTMFGIVSGWILGIVLHQFIIVTAEMGNLMYVKTLEYPSFLWSAVLTLFFACIVNVVVHFKLKKIQMVESLKSVD